MLSPTLRLSDIATHPRLPYFPHEKPFYFRNARSALIAALRCSKRSGKQILVPAYVCSSVTDAIKAAGFSIHYYDINLDLSLPIHYISQIIAAEKVEHVLLLPYFGSTNLFYECANNLEDSIHVILDLSHVFPPYYAEPNTVMPRKHTRIYSSRKYFPCGHGGILFPGKCCQLPLDYIAMSRNGLLLKRISAIVLQLIKQLLLQPAIESIVRDIRKILNPIARQSSSFHLSCSTDDHVHSLLNPLKLEKTTSIKDKRRQNFDKIYQICSVCGVEPLRERSRGEVPLWFACWDDSGAVHRVLSKNRLPCFAWPGKELPNEVSAAPTSFPNSHILNNNLLLLPVHHTLRRKYFESLCLALSSLNRADIY